MRSDRVYFSRRITPRRALQNEDSIEKSFYKRGFDVIFPETLTIESQVSLFASARFIAGPSGSNLFGCLFNRRANSKLILTGAQYIFHNDAVINTAAGADMTYIVGPQSDVHGPFTIDEGAAEEAINDWANRLPS
jgi:capsular polysaccharide biosynthesis protein